MGNLDKTVYTFGNRVKNLMDRQGIRIAELARLTSMPSETIRRIITGNTENPSANTLSSLANFFNVSVDYLLGRGIPKEKNILSPIKVTKFSPEYVILINWDSIHTWFLDKNKIISKKHNKLAVSYQISIDTFATITEKAIGKTLFPKDSILIISPEEEYKDNDYVLVSINKSSPVIREICEDSGKLYLNPIGLNIPALELDPSCIMVYGKIIECRTLYKN